MGLRGAKMGSKRLLKSLKVAKTCICKNLKKPSVFHGFWASKAVQDSLWRPKRDPKRRLKRSKGFKKVDPKMEPILATFWTNFEPLLELILKLKSAPERNQKWTSFGTPRCRVSGGRELLFQEFYERCGKAIGIAIILSKRKGGRHACTFHWNRHE